MQLSVPVGRGRSSGRAGTMSGARAAVWLAGFLLLCFVYFLPRWHDWNQGARMDMTMAIVNHHTIRIDAYQYNTRDDDKFRGHYYSNKAPGQSLLGVPVYAAFEVAVTIPGIRSLVNTIEMSSGWKLALADATCNIPSHPKLCRFIPPRLDYALVQYLESIFTAAIPALLMLLLFFWFLGYFSSSTLNRALLTGALGLGTSVLPYAQNFYSHVPAAACEFTGFVLVYIAGTGSYGPGRQRARWLADHPGMTTFLAGIALGLGAVFEYPAALIVLIVGVYALFRLPIRLIPTLIAGAIPPLAVVMAYNYAAYHNPVTTGYGCDETLWHQECKGLAGFTWPPSGAAIDDMSVGQYRGIFFLSPFLLLAFPAYAAWFFKSKLDRVTGLTLLAVPLVFFLAISMYWGWNGGQVAGPRYLIPMLPFLALPIITVLDRLRSKVGRLAAYGLGALSFINVWLETIGGRAFATGPVRRPLFDWSIPELLKGQVPLNIGMLSGIPGPGSLIPLAAILAVWTAAVLLPASSAPASKPAVQARAA